MPVFSARTTRWPVSTVRATTLKSAPFCRRPVVCSHCASPLLTRESPVPGLALNVTAVTAMSVLVMLLIVPVFQGPFTYAALVFGLTILLD